LLFRKETVFALPQRGASFLYTGAGQISRPKGGQGHATQLVTSTCRKFDFGIFGAKLTTSRLFVEKRNILALIARRQTRPSGGAWGTKLP
jgi:hypothetical protein